MKAAIWVTPAFVCAFSLQAQITATLNRSPDGWDEVRIRNNSAVTLVAFAVTVQQTPSSPASSKAPFVTYSDPLVDPGKKPLPAGEERLVIKAPGFIRNLSASEALKKGQGGGPASRGARRLEEPVTVAGIFEGGATAGDTALLTRLIFRRSNMLLAIETTLDTLSDAGRRNVPRDQLIAQFRKLAGSLHHWYLPPEEQVGAPLYQSMAGKLMNLPEGETGSPFPPDTFVAQETALLTKHRAILLESEPNLADATLIER